MDLSEELDRSFGDGPVFSPAREVLVAGRRAARRRRAVVAATSLAAVAALGGVATEALVPGLDSGTELPVATTSPSPAPPSTDTPDDGSDAPGFTGSLGGAAPVSVGQDGRLVGVGGAAIVAQVDNPLFRESPFYSWAAEVRMGDGRTEYFLVWLEGEGRSPASVSRPAAEAGVSFEDWLAAAVASADGSGILAPSGRDVPNRDLVHLDSSGTGFEALEGVTLLEQQVGIDLGTAAGGATTGVATVRWQGQRFYVAALREAEGPTQYLSDHVSVGSVDTFVGWVRGVLTEQGDLR